MGPQFLETSNKILSCFGNHCDASERQHGQRNSVNYIKVASVGSIRLLTTQEASKAQFGIQERQRLFIESTTDRCSHKSDFVRAQSLRTFQNGNGNREIEEASTL